MDSLEQIQKIIEQAPEDFASKIPDIEKKIFRDVSLLLKDLKVNASGKIVTSVENLKVINNIKAKLGKIVVSKEYANLVNKFVSNLPEIYSLLTSTYQVPNQSKEMINELTKAQIGNTIETLVGDGYKQKMVDTIYGQMLTGVTSGSSYSDLSEQLRSQIVTTDDRQGMLSTYTKIFSDDAASIYDRMATKMVADAMGYNWFAYTVSNITTTREFCEHMTKKRYFHRSEIPTLLAGNIDGHQCEIYEKYGLPKGMREDTNTDNFLVYMGGYRCRHRLIPLSDNSVPQAMRDRFQYPQKEGIIGKEEPKKLAADGLTFDPLQVNSFFKLVDAFNEKAIPKIKKIAFNNMLKHEDYERNGDVFLMKNHSANETEIQSALKLTKAGFYVVFPNKKQLNQIKNQSNDESKKVNDIYAYDKKTYQQYKIDLKSVHAGSKEAISEHINKGSLQAPNIVLDIQGSGVNRWNVIKGIRSGWNDNVKRIMLNWKGQWYQIKRENVFNDYLENTIK